MFIKSKYDLNRYKKVYPLIRTKPVYDELNMIGQGASEVTILDFNNSHEETYTFTETYTQIPVIAATPADDNVNVFITSLTTTSVTIEASANFTGKVHVQVFTNEES